jgi:hypothetical protein
MFKGIKSRCDCYGYIVGKKIMNNNNNTYSRVFRRHLWMMDSSSESESILHTVRHWATKWFHWGKLPIHPPPPIENDQEEEDVISIYTVYIANAALDWYVYGQLWAICLGQGLYKRYHLMQWVTKHSQRLYRWIRDIPSEPETLPWVNVSQLIQQPSSSTIRREYEDGQVRLHIIDHIRLKEEYVMCPDCTLSENVEHRWELITRQQHQHQNQHKQQHIIQQRALWMYKNAQGMYHIRMGYGSNENEARFHDMSKPIPSTIRFLSIEYSHPSMNYTIHLEIPTTMLYVGNYLFFPAFVARMLRYKSCESNNHQSYVFDMNYILRIMDNNLQYMELSSDMSLKLLETNDYEIIKQTQT